jgi:molybdenum cofactor cytidylyltransferase
MISAIVLAAGLSTRMRAFKQLLPYGNHTVIEQVVSVLQTCSIDEIIVVTGHRHDDVHSTLEKYPVRVVHNARYQEEMVTSLQRGWSEASGDAVMHVLGDQPHLDPNVVLKILAVQRAQPGGILIPSYDHHRGHPILLDAKYRAEILALGGTSIMRDFMRAHDAEIRHIEVNTDTILRDMDTPEEYEREIKLRAMAE